ncbi:dUTP diphosphatase [Rhizobium sp. FKL33]|jgi:dUTP pyrophosphatase|uniref:dUTP diphosphatase n=1 Tax=Rhizobium sp. FKL33 TaxID=2562307 RepID=UPI0010C04DA9|nr:dUTP diphosphatase [Rhizobium sp. FKL33]
MSNSTAIPTIGLVRLPHAADLPLPSYETSGAAGMDIRAAAPEDQPMVLEAGERALIPTGFVFEIPEGFEVQVRPRSGLALKHGVTCLNTPGTIDSDYRGEVKVLLVNLGSEPFTVERGMRIAQLVVAPVVQAGVEERAHVSDTTRGGGGFGSTGV